jgi:hypothetical protein
MESMTPNGLGAAACGLRAPDDGSSAQDHGTAAAALSTPPRP